MALFDRVRDRTETDLSDDELQAMIDEAVAEIERRFGVNAALTKTHRGDLRVLTLWRPIDEALAIAVVEINGADEELTLDATDYRVLDGGRTLQRLTTGTNGRARWDRLVKITATPIDDAKQREEVVIKLVTIDLSYRGLDKQSRAGDWQAAGSVTADAYAREREAMLSLLAPRRGLQVA